MNTPAPTGNTAIGIIPPRDVCGFADGYRKLYMPDEMDRIPPHVTVLVPFVPYDQLEEAIPRFERALAGTGPVALALRGFSTFPDEGVLYFHLAHPERVHYLYEKIHAEFPDYLPYGGKHGNSFTPHMTAGLFSNREELERVYEELASQRLFISWDVECLTVVYEVEGGNWLPYAEISLLGNESEANQE